MAAEPNAVEQIVSRTLRDNLEKIQRSVDELHQAVNDMASACASSRAGNALPAMVRAQTTAASLSATLEVLSRLVTGALQPPVQVQTEPQALRMPEIKFQAEPPVHAPVDVPVKVPVSVFEQPPIPPPHPIEHIMWAPPAPVAPMPSVAEIFKPVEEPQAISERPPAEPAAPVTPAVSVTAVVPDVPSVSVPVSAVPAAIEPGPAPLPEAEVAHDVAPVALPVPEPDFDLNFPVAAHAELESPAPIERVEAGPVFNLDVLAPEEQELHRRAFRVAKVSMQDIRMLRPEDVRAGRENKDLCFRLRDDIEKAHKEYDRRFQSIQSHPVDYFYDWMVEILGGGDPQTLGEYPYPSAVLRR
ncbi:MAG TPA: hypothetical protein VFE02_08130 [Candidatus Acidoferrales bacterium]|jgi:uncharacterized damage-inducible protein DinB|nr:hypothetical protein [Candidatus Acidoferrales bacterium]